MSTVAAGIFAKAPVSGRVKTRLVPPLTNDEAAAVARVSLEETLRRFPAAVPVAWTLFLDGLDGVDGTAEPWLAALARARGVAIAPQGTGDLGARLTRAFAALRAAGAKEVVMVGSDSPTLDPARISEAFDRLRTADLALGPARDGGYYLIGTRDAADTLFEGIPWGTGSVAAETLRRAERSGSSVALLPEWYDLDEMADLTRAANDAADCPMLAALLATLLPSLAGRGRNGEAG
jgi:rSAM/selenodomain-associated transferase 1